MLSPLVLSTNGSPNRVDTYYSPKKDLTHQTPKKRLVFSRSTTGTSNGSAFKSCLKSTGNRFNNTHRSNSEYQDISHKAELYESKIRQIDTKITDSHKHDEEKVKSFVEKTFELEENIAANIIAVEFLEERKVKEISLVENTVALDLKNERQRNKETEEKILSDVINTVKAFKADFMEEQKRIQEFKGRYNEIISQQIIELKEGVEQEQVIREQAQENIVSSIGDKLSQIQENIVKNRKIERATHAYLSQKIDEISRDLSQQVMVEKSKRERAESLMIELLEVSCSRFESQVGTRRRKL